MIAVLLLAAVATVKPAAVFTDHMVLQRDRPVPVWGTSEPGAKVTVAFAGQTRSAVADSTGRWEVELTPLKASSEPQALEISSGSQIILRDILVGDVWLISGQSNAEMSMRSVIGKDEVQARAKDFPLIRRMKVSKIVAPSVRTECPNAPWEVGTNDAVLAWTAVGYYFARKVSESERIPIGIIDDNWSGCRIEPFIDPAALAKAEGLEADTAKMAAAESAYAAAAKAAANWTGGPLPKVDRAVAPDLPYGGEFNRMIAPYVKFPIRGALWYQGCSNGGEGESYFNKLMALVRGWRARWGEEFPFYIVQLASYRKGNDLPEGGDGYAKIREAQRKAASVLPKSGLVVTVDIGNATDIHPKNKRDVGERAARWALRNEYGHKEIEPSGPIFRSCVPEKGLLRVSFDHVGKGLMAGEKDPDTPGVPPKEIPSGELKGFAVAGADRKWHWAKAEISGKDLLVGAVEVPEPVAVRYAYRSCPLGNCNLYSRDGLPASPFRSDDW